MMAAHHIQPRVTGFKDPILRLFIILQFISLDRSNG